LPGLLLLSKVAPWRKEPELEGAPAASAP
jgi:hypothetical protein